MRWHSVYRMAGRRVLRDERRNCCTEVGNVSAALAGNWLTKSSGHRIMSVSYFESVTTSTNISMINIEEFKFYSWCMDPHHFWDFLDCHAMQKARTFLYPGFDNPDPVCYRFKGATSAYSSGSFHWLSCRTNSVVCYQLHGRTKEFWQIVREVSPSPRDLAPLIWICQTCYLSMWLSFPLSVFRDFNYN